MIYVDIYFQQLDTSDSDSIRRVAESSHEWQKAVITIRSFYAFKTLAEKMKKNV